MPTRSVRLIPLCGSFGNFSALHPAFRETSGSSRIRSRTRLANTAHRICDPILFYTNVCGNVSEDYDRSNLDSQLKTELLTALQPAFAKISEMGIRYSALPGHTVELADALNEALSAKWRDLRGLEIVSFGVSSVKASEEDEQMLKQMQQAKAYMNPGMAAANLARAQATAMQDAAKNQGGAAMAFMGMNMAQNAGGFNPQNLYQMGAQQPQQAPSGSTWKCACGATATGKFCPECGDLFDENDRK